MIVGLPEKANIKQPVTKKLVYEQFKLTAQERNKFDNSVHKMTIVGEVSEKTVTIAPGKEISRFFIVEVELQSRQYDKKSISLLFKLIPQNIVLILRIDNEFRFAVFKEILIEGDWQDIQDLRMDLTGIDLDIVWENIVKRIGSIEVQDGNSLTEQITLNEQIRKLDSQISSLMSKMHREKQPRKKHELFEEIQKLEDQKSNLLSKEDNSD